MTAWSTLTWTVARAGGFTAYILLTLSVLLGLALSLRWQNQKWPRLLTNEMHSYLALVSLVFIAVHSTAILIDPYIKFGLQDILIPFATSYRTTWVALGIIATYLAIAIWISSQIRPLIGHALWRKLHYATFLVYILTTIHGIATGSDTQTPWALTIYALSILTVTTLLSLRLSQPPKPTPHTQPTPRPSNRTKDLLETRRSRNPADPETPLILKPRRS